MDVKGKDALRILVQRWRYGLYIIIGAIGIGLILGGVNTGNAAFPRWVPARCDRGLSDDRNKETSRFGRAVRLFVFAAPWPVTPFSDTASFCLGLPGRAALHGPCVSGCGWQWTG